MDEYRSTEVRRLYLLVLIFPLLTGLLLLFILAGIFVNQSNKNDFMEAALREKLMEFSSFAENSIRLYLESVRQIAEIIAREPVFLNNDKEQIVRKLQTVSQYGTFEHIALVDPGTETKIDAAGGETDLSAEESALLNQVLEQKKSAIMQTFRAGRDTIRFVLAAPVFTVGRDEVRKVMLAQVLADSDDIFHNMDELSAAGPFALAVTDVNRTAWFPIPGDGEAMLAELLDRFAREAGRQNGQDKRLFLNNGSVFAMQSEIEEAHWRITASMPLTAAGLPNDGTNRFMLYILLAGTLVLAGNFIFCKRLFNAVAKWKREMFTDDKTGLYNFRMFQTCLQHEFIAAKKRGIPLTLLFLDIDHFKKINDRFGHQTGDKILKLVAEQIKRNVRPTDFVARYGGEEIAVICPNTPLEAGREIALRLRYVVKNCTLDEDGELAQEKISVSIGIASSLTAQSKEELIDQADKCMYLAKKKGRDRVVSFNETD